MATADQTNLKSMFTREHIPFGFLLLISCLSSYFYLNESWINDFGTVKPEWVLLVDGLILLPILCFLFIKDKKEALLKALVYACLVVLLGSFIIPESSKFVWSYLEVGRYLLLVALLVLEVIAIVTVIVAIKSALNKNQDPDIAISTPIEKWVGKTAISKLMTLEARVWTYFLFPKKVNPNNFIGDQHFSCHMKDGTQSNLLGFIMVIVLELPLMHLLLHFVWSPFAANIISLLTVIGLVFFIAEYKAIAIRPVSLTSEELIIRYGINNPVSIPLNQISEVYFNSEYIQRSKQVERFNLFGNPNVGVKLKSGKSVFLGVDKPNQFLQVCSDRVKNMRNIMTK